MNQTIKLTRKQAEPILKAIDSTYRGRKIVLEFASKITFYDTNWSGGTHNGYTFLRSNGTFAKLSVPAPWVNVTEGKTVEIPADIMIIERSHFCGQDCGIHIYANPCHAPKWLPAGKEA